MAAVEFGTAATPALLRACVLCSRRGDHARFGNIPTAVDPRPRGLFVLPRPPANRVLVQAKSARGETLDDQQGRLVESYVAQVFLQSLICVAHDAYPRPR